MIPVKRFSVRRRTIIPWAAGLATLALAIAAFRLPALVEPRLRRAIVERINARFDGTAELRTLRLTFVPDLRVTGEGLVLRYQGRTDIPPLIEIGRFTYDTSWWGLLLPGDHGRVGLEGLSIHVPPRGERPQITGRPGGNHETRSLPIAALSCAKAQLVILTDKPGKMPLTFDIEALQMRSNGPGRSMNYSARLINPKPVGQITAAGEFGPWISEDPRRTPVSGRFTFAHADLGTIHGIGGMLSSHGTFSGPLERLEVKGSTETPDFRVTTSEHPVPLHTDYEATVDGTSGDTYLHPVRAVLAGSTIVANGSVVRQEEGGHLITLDVTTAGARIEDLLRVAVKTDPPAMTGPVSFHTRFVLPPGKAAIADRLQLDGNFRQPEAHLTDADAQEKLDHLSLRAQGRPRQAAKPDRPDVLSRMCGEFRLRNGILVLHKLMFQIPAASIELAGEYQLQAGDFDFRGTASFAARASEMTTGIKSILLKAVDPFLAKDGKGTVLPIRISGTGTSPSFSLDLFHRGKP